MHPYATLFGNIVGMFIGGSLFTYLFGSLVGLAMKSMEPDERAVGAALAGWLIIAAIAAFGFGTPIAGLGYIPGAIIGFFMLRKHYWKMWEPDGDELEDASS